MCVVFLMYLKHAFKSSNVDNVIILYQFILSEFTVAPNLGSPKIKPQLGFCIL